MENLNISKLFNNEELDLPKDLVFKHRNVIEKANKYVKSIAEKKTCWEKLTVELDSIGVNITLSILISICRHFYIMSSF